MKKLSVGAKAVSLMSVLLALALCNISCSPSFDVTVPLGESEFPAFGDLLAGAPIPAGFNALSLPIPDGLPSRDMIEGYITDHGFGFILSFVTLEAVELKQMELNASEGSFNGLTLVSFTWNPAVVDGVAPVPVDLGTLTSAEGTLGTDLVFEPDPPVDLLALVDNAATHDAGSTPELSVGVAGHVPNPLPHWNFSMIITISLRIGLS
ncbi:MAG: hypothetical protein NTU83_13545 [Candidatus Hydrogenedentes bacterium]|nr:hypothetical protein [Candidatus Hydrogenedentota bacterium]